MGGQYLVVGGSQGIGEQIVAGLLAQGHQVYVWSRQRLDKPGVIWIENDALEPPYNLAHLPERLDGLVYCPGSIQLKPFSRLTPGDFLQDWRINFLGAVQILQTLHSRLSASPLASVVLFSSVAAQQGMNFHSSIASAKGAVEALVRALAAEWAPKIRVNAVAPSLTRTPLSEKLLATPEKEAAAAQRHPLKTIAEAQDIAQAAQFLLSPQARFITGQILAVDGGLGTVR